MRYFYSLVLYLLVPVVVLRLIYRSFGNPDYALRWNERFGYSSYSYHQGKTIWIHAVSVGEVNATRPILDLIRSAYPDYRLLLTTMTPTGSETVKKLYGDQVDHCYVPYDLPGAVRRFLQRANPILCVVMETELWPNLFHQCRRRSIPIVIANARLSSKSIRGYRRLRPLVSKTLQDVSLIAAQSHEDARRFKTLGADEEQVKVLGNLKFDVVPRLPGKKELDELESRFSASRPVWIAASTHDGEEEIILTIHEAVLKHNDSALLIIAPRHPERFDAVATLCQDRGFHTQRKSEQSAINPAVQVFLLDSLGELITYYAISQLAFVGGSLIPIGGHNTLEPASLALPVVSGPYTHNFAEISERLASAGALFVTEDIEALKETVIQILNDERLRKKSGEAGKAVVQESRGSSRKLLSELNELLP